MWSQGGSPPTFALVSGGGTAGHVQPALAVGEALVAAGHEPSEIHFVGSRRGMEGQLVTKAGFKITLLPGRGIKRRLSLDNVGALAGLAVAGVLAVALVLRRRPRVVVTVGGYAGLPCALAAVLARVPLVVVSYDVVPGASNRLVARFATKCAVAFEGTSLPNQVVTGAPLRSGVLNAERSEQGREEACKALGVPLERFLLVVSGGSLGARTLNQAAIALAKSWATRGEFTVYHVAGDRNLAAVSQEARAAGLGPHEAPGTGLDYRLVGYEARMPELLAACDLAVCRAGASTVAELAAMGVPSALVPLPGAPNDHQTRNAEVLTKVGAAILVPDDECSGARLAQIVESLSGDPERLAAMGKAAQSVGHRDAAARVAEVVESVSKGSK